MIGQGQLICSLQLWHIFLNTEPKAEPNNNLVKSMKDISPLCRMRWKKSYTDSLACFSSFPRQKPGITITQLYAIVVREQFLLKKSQQVSKNNVNNDQENHFSFCPRPLLSVVDGMVRMKMHHQRFCLQTEISLLSCRRGGGVMDKRAMSSSKNVINGTEPLPPRYLVRNAFESCFHREGKGTIPRISS